MILAQNRSLNLLNSGLLLSLSLLFSCITLLGLLAFFGTSSFFIFFILFSINFYFWGNKPEINFLFCIGVIFSSSLFFYWGEIYGSNYYLGIKSDDFNFDRFWTDGYIENYGVSPYNINDHLVAIEGGKGILHNSKGYVYIVILIKKLSFFFGSYHTINSIIFNIYFLLLTSVFTSKIVFHYTLNKNLERIVLFAFFLFPICIFNSSHVFRDTLISLIIVLCIWLKFYSNLNTFYKAFFLVIFLILLFYLRKASFLILLILLLPIKFNKKYFFIYIPILISVVIVSSLIFFKDFFLDLFGLVDRYNSFNVERFEGIGGRIFALPFILGIIPRSLFLFFVPAPTFNTLHGFFISISAYLQVLFFPYLWISLFNKNISGRIKLIAVVLFFSVALTSATFRHVLMYLPFFFILVFLQIKDEKLFKSKIYFKLLLSFILLFALSVLVAIVY